MTGGKDLDGLLETMRPALNAGDYVFCTTKGISKIDLADIIMLFKEEEGYTIVLHKHIADKLQLDYSDQRTTLSDKIKVVSRFNFGYPLKLLNIFIIFKTIEKKCR